jgi:uncharacterized protein with von Willebrand factor type A (vWA) domain
VSDPRGAGALLFGLREARLAPLDDLPRSLWLGSLINSVGSLEPRLLAVRDLRDALLAGNAPDHASACWPDAMLAAALHAVFVQLDLPAMCRERDALAEQVTGSMLWHLDRIVDYVDAGDDAGAAAARAVAGFADEWRERRGMVDELVAVFGALGEILENANWDLLHGLLTSAAWQEIVRIRGLLETLPELARVLRRLGRAQPSVDADESDRVERERREQSSAPRPRIRITHVPEMPGATRGVRRSGRIARMLPSETMLLTHRRLRLVWHARHAERCLLTYEDDERMHQVVLEREPFEQPSPQREPRRRTELGPMLVCVDTSGSMQGGAEAVAKAVVLEAVRTAHAQGRDCHVFAFGGPDEIVEFELRLDATGLERLTDFLGQSFRGGTDICGPLERVLARLADERWRLADLLIASDGEFGATPVMAAATARAKTELGLRVQGVLLGDRETIGLLELADDVFWVRDWRRYGGHDVDAPVPTKSLTAIYFPGALRSGDRVPTVGGDEAARAVVPRAVVPQPPDAGRV